MNQFNATSSKGLRAFRQTDLVGREDLFDIVSIGEQYKSAIVCEIEIFKEERRRVCLKCYFKIIRGLTMDKGNI